MGGAAFFGLALISGSKLVTAMAIFTALSHWWFLGSVERFVAGFAFPFPSTALTFSVVFPCSPHMRKLYGDAMRKDAGITQTLKTVVDRSSLLQRKEMKRVVSEVRGTFDKVDKKITHTVEEFLENGQSLPLVIHPSGLC